MPEESQAVDPYEVVLSDLRGQREKIDNAIRAIEQIRGIAGSSVIVKTPAKASPIVQSAADLSDDHGAFLGLTIVEATKKLLMGRRKTLSNSEIVVALENGGLVLNSQDKLNTVGSILMRRFNTNGDIVRVSRGVWGLQEWYGSRNFKKRESKTVAGILADPTTAQSDGQDGPAPHQIRWRDTFENGDAE